MGGFSDREYLTVLLSVELYVIGYFGLRQPAIFSGLDKPDESERQKYEKSTLTADMAESYLQKLQQA